MPAMMAPVMALNAKQLLFCQHYLTEPNGTQAAVKAGYTPKSAHNQAARMMK